MFEMTNRRLIRVIFGALLTGMLLTLAYPASAQRTISGQSTFAFSAHYTGSFVGAEAFYSQYTLGGFWETGATVSPYRYRLFSGDMLGNWHISAAVGYLWRLAASRSRSFNWYAGAGIFAGIEWQDPFGKLPDYIDIGVADIRFLYGIYAKTALEIFLGPRVALLVQGAAPVNFSSFCDNVHWQAGLGIKFMLN